jgi:hypothetical protein
MEDRVSKKTLLRLERAAMRWYRVIDLPLNAVDIDLWQKEKQRTLLALARACAAHAQRKGAKRKGHSNSRRTR